MGSSVKVALAPACPAFTMNPISKSSAPALVATALREQIEAGRWADRLPGTRVLARQLNVSPPTATLALAQLAAEGYLEKNGERRAYSVVLKTQSSGKPNSDPTPKRLIILTHEDQGQQTETSRNVLDRLREQATAKGWRVEFQVLDFVHVKRPQRAWDHLIPVDPETAVIALYGRQSLAEWAVKRKVRMLFLGGVTNGLPIPMVGVKSSQMAEIALARLTALGHWRIILPLCDRAEAYKLKLREVMRLAVESTGHAYVRNYHNPESDYLKPDVTWRIIESAFSNNPPTAMVFLDWKELITAQCFLSREGLRVPGDVSLVLLNNQMEAEWFHPELSRFRFPERRLVRAMLRWLENSDKEFHTLTLPGEFLEGATITRPKS